MTAAYMFTYLRNLQTLVMKPAGSSRSKYVANEFYLCLHDTRYENRCNIIAIKTTNPLKRVKAYYPMLMAFKITKDEFVDDFPWQITINHFQKVWK